MMADRPLLLDLFCGAGGCSAGYHRAGFDVVGVDHLRQPRYPFRFIQWDAVQFLRILAQGKGRPKWNIRLRDVSVIHASPPCQQFSVAKVLNPRCNHPDLIAETREALIKTGKVYVIENVPRSPLQFPVQLCGLSLGLNVKRHRLFESNVLLFGTDCPNGHKGNYVTVFGHDGSFRRERKRWVTVFGGGAPRAPDNRRRADLATRRAAMGIDWMTRDELSQAIPPAYTEFLGRQLIFALENSK